MMQRSPAIEQAGTREQLDTPQRKDHIDLLGGSLLLGFSVILGLNQALVKIVNEGFAPVFQSGLRSACALPLVLGFALIMRRRLAVNDGTLGLGILNGLLFSGEFCLLFLALDYTTVARVSLFFYIMPVWVAIGAHFFVPGEPLHRNKLLGLALAVSGVAIAFSGDLGAAGEQAWLGDLLALVGGMFWAGIALLTRATRLNTCSAEMNLLYQLAVSAVVLLLIAPLFGPSIREVTATILWVFTSQVVVVVAIGFLMWFWILSIYPVSNMASFGLLTPIFGVLFGWLLFDDPITLTFVAAVALAGTGVVLVNKPPKSNGT
jgi:drug/metabolite transporter (DMT)-like permease